MPKRPEPYELIYMEPRARQFLAAWPKVPEVLQPVYERMYEARIVATPPDQQNMRTRWPTGPTLTNLGYAVKKALDSRSMNYFSVHEILGLWPVDLLARRREDAGKFLALFSLDWNDAIVRRYISDRMTDAVKAMPSGSLGQIEFDAWLAENGVGLGLRQSMKDLTGAFDSLLYQIRMELWRRAPDTHEIPF